MAHATSIHILLVLLGGNKSVASSLIKRGASDKSIDKMKNNVAHWICNNNIPSRYLATLHAMASESGIGLPTDFAWRGFNGGGGDSFPNDAKAIIKAFGGASLLARLLGESVSPNNVSYWTHHNKFPAYIKPRIVILAAEANITLPANY